MRAQGLPVNIIVLVALALLVLIVVAVFFITGMSGASQSINIVNATQAQCNSLCGTLSVSSLNFIDCAALNGIGVATDYTSKCFASYGKCRVSLRNGAACSIPQ